MWAKDFVEAELKVKACLTHFNFTRTEVSLLIYVSYIFLADVFSVHMYKQNKPKYANCCRIKLLSSSAQIELVDSWKFSIIEACYLETSAKVLAITLLSEVQITFEFAQFSFSHFEEFFL